MILSGDVLTVKPKSSKENSELLLELRGGKFFS
jgi:hypothetical protein